MNELYNAKERNFIELEKLSFIEIISHYFNK